MLKALIFALSLLVAAPALAQTAADVDTQIDTVLGPHATYVTAIGIIQKALADHDVQKLAGYIGYGEPIKVNGEDVVINDEADLTARFDDLFNAKVVAAVTGQKYESLLVNDQGIMFGGGELWLNGECVDDACSDAFVTITAINNK